MNAFAKVRNAIAPSVTPEAISRVGFACELASTAIEKALHRYSTTSPSYIEIARGATSPEFAFEAHDKVLAEADAILAVAPDATFMMLNQTERLADWRENLASAIAQIEEFRPRGKR